MTSRKLSDRHQLRGPSIFRGRHEEGNRFTGKIHWIDHCEQIHTMSSRKPQGTESECQVMCKIEQGTCTGEEGKRPGTDKGREAKLPRMNFWEEGVRQG